MFLLAIHYLYRRLKDIPEEQWENFILSYDNMCNVCRMVGAKKPLPLEPPFDKMWFKITKVIDRLHLRNHKNKLCHEIAAKGKVSSLEHASRRAGLYLVCEIQKNLMRHASREVSILLP